MELVFVWLLLAAGIGALASSRGRSGFGFFLLSTVFSPLLGLIVVLVLADLKKQEIAEDQRRTDQLRRESDQQREHERQLESIRAIATSKATAPSDAPASARSIVDEVEKLAGLRDRGVLTHAEFQSQKTALLASRAPAA